MKTFAWSDEGTNSWPIIYVIHAATHNEAVAMLIAQREEGADINPHDVVEAITVGSKEAKRRSSSTKCCGEHMLVIEKDDMLFCEKCYCGAGLPDGDRRSTGSK